jgi:XTP/dITP diphosphohydrolase
MRKFTEHKLVLATHNPGKVGEIVELLRPYGVTVQSAGELGLPVPEETGATCADNALLKARAACAATGLPALADDSGLEVRALNGAPGVHTADLAGPQRDWNLAMQRINDQLADLPHGDRDGGSDRRARFVSVLALCWPDGHAEIVEGEARGTLVWPPRGEIGWGFDPMFVPEGDTRTFAEMGQAEKNARSHRADAFRKLVDACFR